MEPAAQATLPVEFHTGNGEVLPEPYINCMVVRHFGLLGENTRKGGKLRTAAGEL